MGEPVEEPAREPLDEPVEEPLDEVAEQPPQPHVAPQVLDVPEEQPLGADDGPPLVQLVAEGEDQGML